MFNPEEAIAKWREQMRSSGLKSRADLDELESHLRDEIDQQCAKGRDPEQVFDAAVRQVGSVPALNAEFQKVEVAKHEREYKFKQVLCVIGFCFYAICAVRGLFGGLIAANSTERLVGLAAVVVTGFVFYGLTDGWRFAPLIASKKKRFVVAFSGVALSALVTRAAFYLMEFRLNLTVAQLVVVVLWALIPMVAGAAVCTAILEAGDRRSISIN